MLSNLRFVSMISGKVVWAIITPVVMIVRSFICAVRLLSVSITSCGFIRPSGVPLS